jgi:hypothetical protein
MALVLALVLAALLLVQRAAGARAKAALEDCLFVVW